MSLPQKFTIILREGPPTSVVETIFSRNFCKGKLAELPGIDRIVTVSPTEKITTGYLIAEAKDNHLLLINDDELILPDLACTVALEQLATGRWLGLIPVFNTSSNSQLTSAPPYPYHNFRNFLEISQIHFERSSHHPEPLKNISESEIPCIFLSNDVLRSVNDQDMEIELFIEHATEKGEIGVIRSIFVHRFGDYYASPRTDLLELIPPQAFRILDIGCARGELGAELKRQRKCHVTGIEMNEEMAARAAEIYDEIHAMPVEKVQFKDQFDVVVMGDVIEHLLEPSQVLEALYDTLTPGGVIIGSVPNTGHWSIVSDLSAGHFELIPVGLLCMSHIRFFTETELKKLLNQCGFELEHLERDCPAPTPKGRAFIDMLTNNGLGDELSLLTAELRFRAVKMP